MAWLAVSPVLLFTPYWVTNHWHLRPAQPVGLTDMDRLIPFMPGMTAVYLLLFPLIWVAMWVQPDRRALHRWMLAPAVERLQRSSFPLLTFFFLA